MPCDACAVHRCHAPLPQSIKTQIANSPYLNPRKHHPTQARDYPMRVLYFQLGSALDENTESSSLDIKWCLLPGGVSNPDTSKCQPTGADWKNFGDGVNNQLRLTHMITGQFE